MPQVGLGVIVQQAETDQQRLFQTVGLLNGVFQGRVVLGALRLLHEVKDVVAVFHFFIVEGLYTLGLNLTRHSQV